MLILKTSSSKTFLCYLLQISLLSLPLKPTDRNLLAGVMSQAPNIFLWTYLVHPQTAYTEMPR